MSSRLFTVSAANVFKMGREEIPRATGYVI
jgi:hypothetical protein